MRSLLRTQTGSVTAEFAITLPAVIMVASVLLAGMSAGVQQVKLAQSASLLARASARGEDTAALAKQLHVDFKNYFLEDFACVKATVQNVVTLEEDSCARKLGL